MIENLIIENKIEEAIKLIPGNSSILILARWNRNEKDDRLGIISQENYNLERNKIINVILENSTETIKEDKLEIMGKVVIGLFDLENTTMQSENLEKLLEAAYNKDLTIIPLTMETGNQIYYRNYRLIDTPGERSTFLGKFYTGTSDDQRAINSFIGQTFTWLKSALNGASKIYIYYNTYQKEAKMLQKLITGLQLSSKIKLITNIEKHYDVLRMHYSNYHNNYKKNL